MKIKATACVQLGYHIYHKGEVAEYDGEITQRIVDNFVAEDGTKLTMTNANNSSDKTGEKEQGASDEDRIKKCVEVMKREGIMSALDGMNITYSTKSTTTYLAKLLLINKGEITA